MGWMVKALAVAVTLGLAAPSLAASAEDAKDTATEKKAETKKKVRGMKGDKTAEDHIDDAKDTAESTTAKAKKSARKAGRKVKSEAEEATK